MFSEHPEISTPLTKILLNSVMTSQGFSKLYNRADFCREWDTYIPCGPWRDVEPSRYTVMQHRRVYTRVRVSKEVRTLR